MTIEETDRLSVVRQLVEISRSLETIFKQLTKIEWDYEGNGVQLKKIHLTNALQRYLKGELSTSEIENWANGIEGREDIYYDPESEQVIEEIIYELANPTLTQFLNPERAKKILEIL